MTRGFHWVILLGLLGLGVVLRFHQITKVGQWPDEFWSAVHLATGRGAEIFDLPTGVLIDPPPKTLLEGAPSWPHIWTGLRGIVHPPVYFLVLRGWMDLFGSGDLSTRALSAIASLGGIIVLFDIVRRTSGVHAGILAAALMAISPLQIDFSQTARPYTLLALFGLVACQAMVRIEKQGVSRGRLIQLGAALLALALTHYFSLGALVGVTCYAIFRLRGLDRRKTLVAIFCAVAVALICWGPFLWQQRHEFFNQQSWSLESSNYRGWPLIRSLALPSALLYGRFATTSAWIGLSVIALLLPLLCMRRAPQLMLWWFWIVGIIGSLAVYDWVVHARLLVVLRYSFLASVGLCAIFATPLPIRKWWRWVIPYALLASTVVAMVDRLQVGPTEENGDWRGMALTVNRKAGPHDPLVFYLNGFWRSPVMYYLAFSHYAEDSQRPVMFLNRPADARGLGELSKYPHVWLIGPTLDPNGPAFLPGWRTVYQTAFPNCGVASEMAISGPGRLPEELPGH